MVEGHRFKWLNNYVGRVNFVTKVSQEQAKTVRREWASLLNGKFTRLYVGDKESDEPNLYVVKISFPVAKGGATKHQKLQRQIILRGVWRTIQNA